MRAAAEPEVVRSPARSAGGTLYHNGGCGSASPDAAGVTSLAGPEPRIGRWNTR